MPLEHQVSGAASLLERITAAHPSGMIVADDMGLGKTLTVLLAIRDHPALRAPADSLRTRVDDWSTTNICFCLCVPKSTIGSWQRVAASLNCAPRDGPAFSSLLFACTKSLKTGPLPPPHARILLISHTRLQNHLRQPRTLAAIRLEALFLDEAHLTGNDEWKNGCGNEYGNPDGNRDGNWDGNRDGNDGAGAPVAVVGAKRRKPPRGAPRRLVIGDAIRALQVRVIVPITGTPEFASKRGWQALFRLALRGTAHPAQYQEWWDRAERADIDSLFAAFVLRRTRDVLVGSRLSFPAPVIHNVRRVHTDVQIAQILRYLACTKLAMLTEDRSGAAGGVSGKKVEVSALKMIRVLTMTSVCPHLVPDSPTDVFSAPKKRQPPAQTREADDGRTGKPAETSNGGGDGKEGEETKEIKEHNEGKEGKEGEAKEGKREKPRAAKAATKRAAKATGKGTGKGSKGAVKGGGDKEGADDTDPVKAQGPWRTCRPEDMVAASPTLQLLLEIIDTHVLANKDRPCPLIVASPWTRTLFLAQRVIEHYYLAPAPSSSSSPTPPSPRSDSVGGATPGAREPQTHPAFRRGPPPIFHGGLSDLERQKMIDRFQAYKYPVLLMSMKAGGVGTTLTAAHHVYNIDSWWNVFLEDQTYARVWRPTLSHEAHVWLCTYTDEIAIGRLVRGKQLDRLAHACQLTPDLKDSLMMRILRSILGDIASSGTSSAGFASLLAEWSVPVVAKYAARLCVSPPPSADVTPPHMPQRQPSTSGRSAKRKLECVGGGDGASGGDDDGHGGVGDGGNGCEAGAADRQPEWACGRCTFLNPSARISCQVCSQG